MAGPTPGVRWVLGGVLLVTLFLVFGVCLPASRLETGLAQEAPPDQVSQVQVPSGGPREAQEPPAGTSANGGRPNILLILTDDQEPGSVAEMPNVRSLLAAEGTSFDRAFVTTALCCPSRSSILRGQYAHNHRIWTTQEPYGGFARFRDLGLEKSTVATWLDGAGYHTGYMGKYLNDYGSFDRPTDHVPPGWDRWVGYEGGPNQQLLDGAFKVNDGGDVDRVDTGTVHDTDFLAGEAEDYIRNRSPENPWFLAVGTNAPHEPAEASGRNDGTYAGEAMPKGPAFNEADISDKGAPWRDNPRLPKKCPKDYRKKPQAQCLRDATEHWRDRMESLQDVDDMVGRLVGALRDEGTLENTYIVFTSDNGFAMYDNRVFSKGAPYEDSHGVPLIVRGPGVPADHTDGRLVANIDLAPTFAAWAGVRTPSFVDGRSLLPVLSDPRAPWRKRLLFEHRLGNHAYDAIRTSSAEVYIEYPRTNETEYYDLKRDPHQLNGQAEKPPPKLEDQLQTLGGCAAAGCRRADGGP